MCGPQQWLIWVICISFLHKCRQNFFSKSFNWVAHRCIARLSTWRNRTTVATASSGSSFDLPACSSYSKPPFSNDSLTSSCSRATPSVNDLPASSFSEAPSVLHTDSACSSSVHQVNHEITGMLFLSSIFFSYLWGEQRENSRSKALEIANQYPSSYINNR